MSGTTDGVRNAPTTQGGFLLVSLYSWTCITWGIMIVRLVLSLIIHRVGFGKDDATALIGSIVFLGVTVTGQSAVTAGLGEKPVDVEAEDIGPLFEALYFGKFFAVLAMAFGKLSFAFLIARVVPQTKMARRVLFGMVGVWSVFSVFATAFQCGVPKVWEANSVYCGNDDIMLTVVVTNVLSDVALTAWILPTLRGLVLDRASYWTATMLIGCRAVVPLLACVQTWLVLRGRLVGDPGKYAVDISVMSHAVTSLSLITASIPRIKRSLAIGSSSILYPQIHETELTVSNKPFSRQTTVNAEPQLVPSGEGKFSVSITAKGKRPRSKSPQPYWQGLVSVGRKEDEHTSTSSLFDRNDHGGVMMHQDFRVDIEEGDVRKEHETMQ